MREDAISANNEHTLVCEELEAGQKPDCRSDAFLALIKHHIALDSRTLVDLAALLGISRRQLGRILGGQKALGLAQLRALTDLLAIDRARATVAIEVIGDWRSYDDPGLCIIMQLLRPVVTKLAERAEFPLEPLSRPAEDTLADWIATTIITNEMQIRNRRDAFIKLPQI